MNYSRLHMAILDKYWDDTSERVTNLLQRLAKKRGEQDTKRLKEDKTLAQCGCGSWVRIDRPFASCSRCKASFW